jgi:tetratricopeptide (TPR) repeat protein
MSEIWYYAGQDGSEGPVTVRELKDALARFTKPRDVLVWRDGFSQWTRAKDVPELKTPEVPAPPPLPSRKRVRWNAGVFAMIIVVIVIGVSTLLLQREKLKDDCSSEGDRSIADIADRTISGCTLIIQDQSLGVEDLAIAYTRRGFAYDAKGDIESAIADYTEVIRLDAKAANVYYSRGHAYQARGDSEQAIADYSEAIRLDNESGGSFGIVKGGEEESTVYYDRGLAFHARGDYDRAIADYREAITLNPDYESKLEAAFKSSMKPPTYESLVAERRAKLIASLKADLISGAFADNPSVDLSRQYEIYIRLGKLEPGNVSHKQNADRLTKQIAARRAAEEKARKDAESKRAAEKDEGNLNLASNKTFLASNPYYLEAIHELVTRSGYECPQVQNLWVRGTSPLGAKLEALCGPRGSTDVYPVLHYTVYPERLRVDVCKPFGMFGGGCE